jgi:hypothetical protein
MARPVDVPIDLAFRSMTRAISGGTATLSTGAAAGANTSARMPKRRIKARTPIRSGASRSSLYLAGAGAGLSKFTVGGVAMAFSFSTAKLDFTW